MNYLYFTALDYRIQRTCRYACSPLRWDYDESITRTMQGIPLPFRPPTVRNLQYCAAEEMTNLNFTQFCTAQLHLPGYVCAWAPLGPKCHTYAYIYHYKERKK